MPRRRRANGAGRTRKRGRGNGRGDARQPRLEVYYGPEAGPGVEQAPLEEVLAAIAAHGEDLEWSSVSSNILPIIPRLRPYPAAAREPLRTLVPPGIMIGFGIDIGPAFMNVTSELLASWGTTVGDLTACAVANLHRRAASIEPSAIYEGSIGEYATGWLQTGVSVGSTLVLAPTELRRLFDGPRFFITPMRDLIIGFPLDVAREAALWLYHEIADLDPNCLGPIGYCFDGVRVVPESLDLRGPARTFPGSDMTAIVA